MRNPRDFLKPLAIDAPDPIHEIPFRPSRMIHFLDFSNEKMVAKAPDIAPQVDILLGNLEDAIPVDRKEAAREGLIRVGSEMELGETQLWTRINGLESPWMLDDLMQLVAAVGDRLDVVMVPKVEGDWDIHYLDRLLAQLEAKAGLDRPILIHAILETAQGVTNLEAIATASPRMQGMSFGPADLAANRRMKTTRVGGGHPGYRVIEDPDPDNPDAPRAHGAAGPLALLDSAHGRRVRGRRHPALLRPVRRHQGHRGLRDPVPRGVPARLRGRVVPASRADRDRQAGLLADPDEVKFAKKVIEAIPDGRGVHMIDGKMQDDATWKQCKVMVELAEMLARKDPELAQQYELSPSAR